MIHRILLVEEIKENKKVLTYGTDEVELLHLEGKTHFEDLV